MRQSTTSDCQLNFSKKSDTGIYAAKANAAIDG